MTKTIPLTQAQIALPSLVSDVAENEIEYVITVEGEPKAVLSGPGKKGQKEIEVKSEGEDVLEEAVAEVATQS